MLQQWFFPTDPAGSHAEEIERPLEPLETHITDIGDLEDGSEFGDLGHQVQPGQKQQPCRVRVCKRAGGIHVYTPSEGYPAMISTMTTVLGLGLALYVSQVAYNQGGLFAWHPVLMSLSALGLSTAGIQAVRSRHAVGGIQPKTQRVQVRARL